MVLELKIFDGSDVSVSYLDSSKSQVYVDSSKISKLSLFDPFGNEILTVVSSSNL